MTEKKFTCVLGKDYHIINNNVDNMSYYLQDGNDVVLVINLLNRLFEENEQLRLELETHKHPLWSTREAERKLSEVTDNLADEVKKNGLLNEELNQLRIENMRLKKKVVNGV